MNSSTIPRYTLFGVAILSTFVGGCGSFDRPDATALVQRVGQERILSAAESLRARGSGRVASDVCTPVAREKWPEPIRLLTPESVCVESQGIYVRKRGFFVQEEGIYIVFDGALPPAERWGDPSFWRVSGRLYWYQFTG